LELELELELERGLRCCWIRGGMVEEAVLLKKGGWR